MRGTKISLSLSLSLSPLPLRHVISSEIWDSFHLQHLVQQQQQQQAPPTSATPTTTPISISQAIHMWMATLHSCSNQSIQFQDACDGPYCNSECPETVVLGEVQPYWAVPYQIIILVLTGGVALVGVAVKVGLSLRELFFEHKQKNFLKWIVEFEDGSVSAVSLIIDILTFAL